MKNLMKRFIELSLILVLCLFAASVANAETYDGECYDGTIVPDFGAVVSDEPFNEAFDIGLSVYRYKIETSSKISDYISALESANFDYVSHLTDSDSKHDDNSWVFVNAKEGTSVFFGTRCCCDFNDDDKPYEYSDYIYVSIRDGYIPNENLSTSDSHLSMNLGKECALKVVSGVGSGTSYTILGNKNAIRCSGLDNWTWDETTDDSYSQLRIKATNVGTAYIVLNSPRIWEAVIVKVTVSDSNTQKASKKVTKKLPSATTYKASPGLGKGTWKTSNSSIVSLSQKKGSTCTFKLKKAGKAKVTFKSDLGTYVYNITVHNKKSDPIRAGFIEMNSADGIEPTLFIANNSGKSIKYVDFNATFYNAVGDKVRNDIGNSYSKALQIIGPIKPWTMDYFKWDPVFYSPVVKRMYVKSATITYMDGSKKTVSIRKSFSYSKKDANKYYKYI